MHFTFIFWLGSKARNISSIASAGSLRDRRHLEVQPSVFQDTSLQEEPVLKSTFVLIERILPLTHCANLNKTGDLPEDILLAMLPFRILLVFAASSRSPLSQTEDVVGAALKVRLKRARLR
jgi:hypothetical protein